MVIFYSYVSLPEGNQWQPPITFPHFPPENPPEIPQKNPWKTGQTWPKIRQVTEVTAAELSRDVDSDDSEDVAAERFIGAAVRWEEMMEKWWRTDG